jgi:serine/threonine protein phosphatase 1
MKTFVLGDLHGGYKALMQVLDRSNFDYERDRLISLGDIADGWTEVVECFEEFFKMKHFVMVRGNHDQWLKNWLQKGEMPNVWTMQGGKNTLESYARFGEPTKSRHLGFLRNTKHWFIDEKNRLYVHGGYIDGVPLEEQDKMDLMWSRRFKEQPQLCEEVKDFAEVFIGHTTIWRISQLPFKVGRVTFMDTGGGWEGKLSLMNVDTRDVFQSDLVSELYPNVKPR